MKADSTSMETRHLTDAELASYLDGTAPATVMSELESHLAACADCRRDMIEVGRLVSKASPRSVRRTAMWLAPVVAAAALILIAVPTLFRADDGEPTLRTPAETSTAVEVLEPGPAVALGEAVRFRWREVAGAVSYRVTVLSDDGSTIWTAETSSTSIALPSDIELTAATAYHWHVDALLARGESLTSGLKPLTVQP